MRATSKAAFDAIKTDGTLGRLQRVFLDALREYGPMTSAEIEEKTGSRGIWKRASELERMGLIMEAGTKTDPVTRKQVTIWQARDWSGAQLDMFGGVA